MANCAVPPEPLGGDCPTGAEKGEDCPADLSNDSFIEDLDRPECQSSQTLAPLAALDGQNALRTVMRELNLKDLNSLTLGCQIPVTASQDSFRLCEPTFILRVLLRLQTTCVCNTMNLVIDKAGACSSLFLYEILNRGISILNLIPHILYCLGDRLGSLTLKWSRKVVF
jgi:hypothetical protein